MWGAYTKKSAIYVEGVAKHLALQVKQALTAAEEPRETSRGLESVILNDLLISHKWRPMFSCDWKTPAHIMNVLESHSYLGLLHRLAQRGGRKRFVALLDSRVAKGARAKGRSSARTLQQSLRKACAITVAANLHPSFGFAPTRLNAADAPHKIS